MIHLSSMLRRRRSTSLQPSSSILLPLLLLLLVAACERRPLEVIVDETVRVRLVVRWDVNFQPIYDIEPNGMTVMLWGQNDSIPIVETSNSNSVTLHLAPDVYRMIIFNETQHDFEPYLNFFDTHSYYNIAARSATYTRGWDGFDSYLHYPDPIAVSVDTFEITRDMVLQDTTVFIPYERYVRQGSSVIYRESERVYEIPEVPYPMTVNLFVRAKVKRRQCIKSIEASISGMAQGFYLSRVNRTSESGVMQLPADIWQREVYGEGPDSMGVIACKIASFGLPYGKETRAERDSTDNILSFNVTLVNDSVVQYRYPVGKSIHYITPEGDEARIRYRQDLHNLRLEIELPDTLVVPYAHPVGGAGFDATVDPWQPGGTIDLGGF